MEPQCNLSDPSPFWACECVPNEVLFKILKNQLPAASVALKALFVELGHSLNINYYKAYTKEIEFLQRKQGVDIVLLLIQFQSVLLRAKSISVLQKIGKTKL